MPIVTLLPTGKAIEVPPGTLLFDAVCRAGLPIASSCSAQAVCGKCVLKVVQGFSHLSEVSSYERKLLQRDQREDGARISCMTKVFGDCSVQATYW